MQSVFRALAYSNSAGHRSSYTRGTTLLEQDNGAFCRRAPRLQVDPFLQMGGADEGQHGLGNDCPRAVEAVSVHGHVAVGEEVGLDDGFEGSFAMPLAHTFAPSARPREVGVGIPNHVVTGLQQPQCEMTLCCRALLALVVQH